MEARPELVRSSTVTYNAHTAEADGNVGKPLNNFVNCLLTDLYQLTMAHAYWKAGKHEQHAVFDLFFRKNPFKGEFTVFAGLSEVLRFLHHFRFREHEVAYLREVLPSADPAFFEWLLTVDASKLKVWAVEEGSVVFPREPLLRLEGPLAVCQLVETTLLCLVNYPSLIATNAARHRLAAGDNKTLLEFGLRRAQGPDGAMSAARYSYLGGFDSSSNVLAGHLFGLQPKGTHAHAFVSSFVSLDEVAGRTLAHKTTGEEIEFTKLVLEVRAELGLGGATNDGELAAFIAYACAFPNGFLALVDTYDTIHSGVPNFVVVATALHRTGYQAVGIRLDSGDLAYLSNVTRKYFVTWGEKLGVDYYARFNIVASNDLNEKTLMSLNAQGHEIDTFGVGTNLVTCQAQPALGCVYKLVEIEGVARIKLSQEITKVTLPGRKEVYRLYGATGFPVVDLMVRVGSPVPREGERILCRHPFNERKRCYVTPARVVPLHRVVWDGEVVGSIPPLSAARARCREHVRTLRPDHLRFENPTDYKVSVTAELYDFVHDLWQQEAPIPDVE